LEPCVRAERFSINDGWEAERSSQGGAGLQESTTGDALGHGMLQKFEL